MLITYFLTPTMNSLNKSPHFTVTADDNNNSSASQAAGFKEIPDRPIIIVPPSLTNKFLSKFHGKAQLISCHFIIPPTTAVQPFYPSPTRLRAV